MSNKKDLIERIKSGDRNVRGDAWQRAGDAGPEFIKPLAAVMATGELEIVRAAKRALWKIVRHVGRPGAKAEKTAVIGELVGLLGDDKTVPVRREVLWMLSEIAEAGATIERMAGLLVHGELREDARLALERIPGKASLAALQGAMKRVAEEFKPHIAQSLRARGVKVSGYPCEKLIPRKKTSVRAVGV